MREPIEIGSAFQTALRSGDGALQLHYQPIITLETGQVAGFEALMRWTHPEKGPIPPGVFIPVIEKNGMIIEASRWALGEACRALKRIEGRVGSAENPYMSVNFSDADFASENFVEHLYRILSESDVQAERVCLEITERLLIRQPDNARATLAMCRQAGMRIAIDDFGAGDVLPGDLRDVPIDIVKIDQSVIRPMMQDGQSLERVTTLIAQCKTIRMQVAAEGVETAAEAGALKALGCDCAQGYYFARPMPEKAVIELLRGWQPRRLGNG